jgi:16S rRNA (adenine1518-N6/adenine1519-N6)-dimethyltransferase
LCLSLNYTTPKAICKVAPGAFSPPPKVDSIVVSYARKNKVEIVLNEFSTFESFLRLLFAGKRKQLGRVLKSQTNLIQKLKENGFELTRRAETLDFKEVTELYALHKS